MASRLDSLTIERVDRQIPTTSTVGGSRLSQLGRALVEQTTLPKTKPIIDLGTSISNISALGRGEVKVSDVAREIPGQAVKTIDSLAKTFVPALTNFFKTTGSIFGEGLAYAVDENVRKQYKAGNLDILPTITETTVPKLAKATFAAGLETAVYRSFPQMAQQKLLTRGGAGALQGLGFALASGLAEDKTAEEIIDDLPIYGIGGSVLGVISPYLLPILKAEMRQVPQEVKNMFKGLKEEIRPPAPRKIGVTSEDGAPIRIPISTPNSRYEAYLRSQGYEPYVPNEKLPTIEMGAKPKSSEPTIQIGEEAPLPAPAGTRLVPEKPPKTETPSTTEASDVAPPQKTPQVEGETRTTRVSQEQLPVGEGATRASRLEARMTALLDDSRTATQAEKHGVSTYQQMNKKEQISGAVKYVEQNQDEALAVVRGEKPPPAGLLNNSIALALEQKAAEQADAALAIRLASLRSTRAGQEISILTEADPSNPINAINEIIKARTARIARQTKKGETVGKKVASEEAAVRNEVEKARIKVEEAERILDDLQC